MNGSWQVAGRGLSAIGGDVVPRASTLNERVTKACGNLESLCAQMEGLYERVAAVNRAQDPKKVEAGVPNAMPFEHTVLRLEQLTARMNDVIDRLQIVA